MLVGGEVTVRDLNRELDLGLPEAGNWSTLGGLWNGRGLVRTFESDYKRYVGAQIGIYNPSGEKVGKVSHLRNTEYLYVAAAPEHADAIARAWGGQLHTGPDRSAA